MKLNGLIVKGIGGFYYVETADGLYECKARGVFRKKRITPLVGDKVSISVNTNAENTIDEIFERKNSLVRPPLANIDTLFIVSSIVDPQINTVVLRWKSCQKRGRQHDCSQSLYRRKSGFEDFDRW